MKLYDYTKLLMKSIAGGIMISFGGMAYLSIDNKVIGACLFSIGLFVILNFQYALFTGKAYTVYDTHKFWEFPIIYVGNLTGTFWMGSLSPYFNETAQLRLTEITTAKLTMRADQLIVLAILCNILIAIAVKCFNTNEGVVRYIGTFLAIPTFILCGFEHSIADMFYFSCIGWSDECLTPLLLITCGNLIGGFVFWLYDKMTTYTPKT